VAALAALRDRGEVDADARVALVLTGAGIKYDAPPLADPVDLDGTGEEVVAAVRCALGGA
jgi:threonine synthase